MKKRLAFAPNRRVLFSAFVDYQRCRHADLGCTTVDGLQYHARQFRNMKGTIALDALNAAELSDYTEIVGHLLAKGHARTNGASMIAEYAGSSDKLDRALCRCAKAHADPTEADHQTLVKALPAFLPISYLTNPRIHSVRTERRAIPRVILAHFSIERRRLGRVNFVWMDVFLNRSIFESNYLVVLRKTQWCIALNVDVESGTAFKLFKDSA